MKDSPENEHERNAAYTHYQKNFRRNLIYSVHTNWFMT
jgi:hypothetical protein